MEQYLEQPASRLRFLRQLGVSVAAGLGGAAVMSRTAFAGAPIAHGPGDRWAPISRPGGDTPLTPYCCLNNTNCTGTCPQGYFIFYCSCASPYCECYDGKSCYPAPC